MYGPLESSSFFDQSREETLRARIAVLAAERDAIGKRGYETLKVLEEELCKLREEHEFVVAQRKREGDLCIAAKLRALAEIRSKSTHCLPVDLRDWDGNSPSTDTTVPKADTEETRLSIEIEEIHDRLLRDSRLQRLRIDQKEEEIERLRMDIQLEDEIRRHQIDLSIAKLEYELNTLVIQNSEDDTPPSQVDVCQFAPVYVTLSCTFHPTVEEDIRNHSFSRVCIHTLVSVRYLGVSNPSMLASGCDSPIPTDEFSLQPDSMIPLPRFSVEDIIESILVDIRNKDEERLEMEAGLSQQENLDVVSPRKSRSVIIPETILSSLEDEQSLDSSPELIPCHSEVSGIIREQEDSLTLILDLDLSSYRSKTADLLSSSSHSGAMEEVGDSSQLDSVTNNANFAESIETDGDKWPLLDDSCCSDDIQPYTAMAYDSYLDSPELQSTNMQSLSSLSSEHDEVERRDSVMSYSASILDGIPKEASYVPIQIPPLSLPSHCLHPIDQKSPLKEKPRRNRRRCRDKSSKKSNNLTLHSPYAQPLSSSHLLTPRSHQRRSIRRNSYAVVTRLPPISSSRSVASEPAYARSSRPSCDTFLSDRSQETPRELTSRSQSILCNFPHSDPSADLASRPSFRRNRFRKDRHGTVHSCHPSTIQSPVIKSPDASVEPSVCFSSANDSERTVSHESFVASLRQFRSQYLLPGSLCSVEKCSSGFREVDLLPSEPDRTSPRPFISRGDRQDSERNEKTSPLIQPSPRVRSRGFFGTEGSTEIEVDAVPASLLSRHSSFRYPSQPNTLNDSSSLLPPRMKNDILGSNMSTPSAPTVPSNAFGSPDVGVTQRFLLRSNDDLHMRPRSAPIRTILR